MLEIELKNGRLLFYCDPEGLSDYEFDGKCFTIVRNGVLTGVYNIDSVAYINVGRCDGDCENCGSWRFE